MFIDNRERITTVILASVMLLSGCAKIPDTNYATTANTNQPVVRSDNSAPNVNSMRPGPLPPETQSNTASSNRKAAPPVPMPTPVIGSGGDDFSLFSQLRSSMSTDPEFINSVIMQVKDGNVILTGTVKSEAQKARAGKLAAGVKGVKSVNNNLKITP